MNFNLINYFFSSSGKTEPVLHANKNSHTNIACTSFATTTKTGKVFHSRSMEFPKLPMKSLLTFHNVGEKCQSFAPGDNNPPGISWTATIGYAGISIFGAGIVDGMNTAGLSCSFNSLNCTQYQTVPANSNSQALELFDVGSYLLGNFSNVNDAIMGLKTVYVWGKLFPLLGEIPGLHIALHDKSGNSAVIEYLNGNLTVISPNPVGVMTNDPPFPWHITNLSQYNYISANPAPNVTYKGFSIPGLGPGSGMPLPGGFDTVSRFVKIFQLCRFATPVQNTAEEVVNDCLHILSNVDKPVGVCLWPEGSQVVPEYTRWCVVKDLTDSDFYFYSHKNILVKVVHLSQMNFSGSVNYPSIEINHGHQHVHDVTPQPS